MSLALGEFVGAVVGPDDRYRGAADDEVVGVICALDRVEAHVAARKLGAVAEFIRRRPARGPERAATALGLADRPGQAGTIGPVDPDPGTNTYDRYQTGHRLMAPTRVLICFYAHHC